ncbi:6868_t:CDS:1, partial [Racocetra fulgida]
IIEDFRPMINDQTTPLCIIQLIKQCWDADPGKRPTARELKDQFDKLLEFNISEFQFEHTPSNFQVQKSSE